MGSSAPAGNAREADPSHDDRPDGTDGSDLTVADAAKLAVTAYQVNERKSLTDGLGRIKHLIAYFVAMKLSQITTATMKAYIKHRRSEERIVSRERTILTLKSATDIRSPRVEKREQTSANRWHVETRSTLQHKSTGSS